MMAMHPRLASTRSKFLGQLAGEWLVFIAAVLLLLGFAVLPWYSENTFFEEPNSWTELWITYAVPIAGLLALTAAVWGSYLRQHAHSAAALALIAGNIAWINFANYFWLEERPLIDSGFILAIMGAVLLLIQIFIPREVIKVTTQNSFEQFLATRIHWLRNYVLLLGLLAFLIWLFPMIAAKPTYRIVHSGVLGILEGSLYALIALGIIIINKATGVFNFGHGAMMLLGGMIMFSFFQSTQIHPAVAFAYSLIVVCSVLYTYGIWRQRKRLIQAMLVVIALSILLVIGGEDWRLLHGLVGTLMGAIVLGFLVERVAIRPLLGQPIFAVVMATIALEILLRGIVRVLWGAQVVNIPLFYFVSKPTVSFSIGEGRVFIFTAALVGMIIALLAYLAFMLFFRYSKIGLSMRAAAENQRLAQSLGLQVRILLSFTWGVAAVFAALAGSLLGASKGIASEITPALALKAFPAVLLGGLESIPGALVGGLILGIAEQYSVLLFSTDVATQLVPFALLMIVLIIRPQGLFGLKRIERI